MTRELFWLTCTVILTGILWIPYTINRCQVRGLGPAPWPTPRAATSRNAEWANRLMFAHDNAVENLVLFAPLVLILNAIDYSSKWTVLACVVYFWARVAHLIVYALGIPVFRTIAFTVGFAWRRPCWRWRSSSCSEGSGRQRQVRRRVFALPLCIGGQ